MAGTGGPAATETTWLVGDIGGTNARFGLVAPGGALLHSNAYAVADFATIEDAIRAFLDTRGELPMPRLGALSIAAAITGDRIRMTNHPWSFSVTALRDRLGFARLVAINDFTAVAMAVPLLGEADRQPIGGGAPVAGQTIAVLGPGSGLGASGLVPTPAGAEWIALSGEGGHATMAPASDRESAVLDVMRAPFRPRLGRALHLGAGSRQSLQQPGGARRSAGGVLYAGADHRSRDRRAGSVCAVRRPRCSARCSAPWPAISR